MQYQLKLQQLVTYARCRIYRKFIQSLSEDTNIRLNGDSNLFYFLILCSFANFRTSYITIDGISYTVAPGEWIIDVSELAKLFRRRTMKSTLEILNHLSDGHWITYTVTHKGQYVRFSINNWSKFNTIVEANAPCTKDDGFFFFPYRLFSNSSETVNARKWILSWICG